VSRSWRWQDGLALVAGAVLALTPIWASPAATKATWTMVVLGVILAAASVWSLLSPERVISEWAHVALGVLIAVSPWALGFTAHRGAAWTAWVVGVIALLLGAWMVPVSGRLAHDHGAAPTVLH